MHIFDFFRDIFSFFGAFSRFLGVKFGFRKSCLCKRNDKYEVCHDHHDHPQQAGRLERLDLSYNNLKELDSATLASLPNLLVLKVNSTIQHDDHHHYCDHYHDYHQLRHPCLSAKPARSQGELNIITTMTMFAIMMMEIQNERQTTLFGALPQNDNGLLVTITDHYADHDR